MEILTVPLREWWNLYWAEELRGRLVIWETPHERFCQTLFGELPNYNAFYDRPEFLADVIHADSQGKVELLLLEAAIVSAMEILNDHERRVIQLHYGFDGLGTRTLKIIGQGMRVTPERIRQIEARAFRKLRMNRTLRMFRCAYTEQEDTTAQKRQLLHRALCDHGVRDIQAYGMARFAPRAYLDQACAAVESKDFKALSRALALGCVIRNEYDVCSFCGELTFRGWMWCLAHLHFRGKVVLICDGCGVKFVRGVGTITGYTRHHGRTPYKVFHDRPCFNAHFTGWRGWEGVVAKERQVVPATDKLQGAGADVNSVVK